MYNKLVELMDKHNISAYRLSQETNITQATLSRWKTGKTSPSIDTLQVLAEYFKVPVDYFLNDEEKNYLTDDESGKVNEDIKNSNEEDENIIIINRAARKMSPEKLKKLIDIAKVMFNEEFDD